MLALGEEQPESGADLLGCPRERDIEHLLRDGPEDDIGAVLAAKTPRTCPGGRSARARSARPLPVWDERTGNYVDPATGEVLPTWDQALDELGDQPHHVARFGVKFDAQGVLAGSKDAARCIGYLTKYLTKQVGDCHHPDTDAQRAHAARLAEGLRYQPCSPTCANWLRYGVQPKKALEASSVIGPALDACGRKLDGSAASAEYYRRRRRVFTRR